MSAKSVSVRGHSASPGLGLGAAFWMLESPPSPKRRKISRPQVSAELARLQRAYRSAILELYEFETRKTARAPGLKDILAAHRMMIDDPDIRSRIESRVRRELICAEWAVEEAYTGAARAFDRMKSRHLAARREDVRDVMRLILDHLAGRLATAPASSRMMWPDAPFVAVAHELSPAQTAALLTSKVVGMVARLGGRTSHSAILAREMGIPLVFGIPAKSLNQIRSDDVLLVDGAEGRVILNPSPAVLRSFRRRISTLEKMQRDQQVADGRPARTADGVEVFLRANIEIEREAETVGNFGAAGIGLFRTEYLYLSETMPDEETLFRAYRGVARKVSPHPVVVRTIDLGGDKFMSPVEFPPEINPMLGMRAVRLCLAQPALLRPQLCAALRANLQGNLKLMLPLISAVEEVVRVREHMAEAERDLRRRRIPYRVPPLGIMVEVPSVAVCIDRFLHHSDFFSIGTNDLIQYTLAVSRTQERVAYLYRPLHPGVLALISQIVRVCCAAGKEVSVCGEEANNPLIVPFLLGIGLRDLSMAPPAIFDIKKLIGGLRVSECRMIARRMLEFATTDEVEKFIRKDVYPIIKRIIPMHYTYTSLESEL